MSEFDSKRSSAETRVQVEVVDGRVLEGDFSCLDTRGNLVLSNAYLTCAGCE